MSERKKKAENVQFLHYFRFCRFEGKKGKIVYFHRYFYFFQTLKIQCKRTKMAKFYYFDITFRPMGLREKMQNFTILSLFRICKLWKKKKKKFYNSGINAGDTDPKILGKERRRKKTAETLLYLHDFVCHRLWKKLLNFTISALFQALKGRGKEKKTGNIFQCYFESQTCGKCSKFY